MRVAALWKTLSQAEKKEWKYVDRMQLQKEKELANEEGTFETLEEEEEEEEVAKGEYLFPSSDGWMLDTHSRPSEVKEDCLPALFDPWCDLHSSPPRKQFKVDSWERVKRECVF